MQHQLQDGEECNLRRGQLLFSGARPYTSGRVLPMFVLEGEVSYTCKSSSGKFVNIPLGPSSLIGLECIYTESYPVSALVTRPTRLYQWSIEAFEMYLGKDIEFAVKAITSLSRQQRLVDTELLVRSGDKQEKLDSASMLFVLGKKNYDAGYFDVALSYFEQLESHFPSSNYLSSASGYMKLLRQKKAANNTMAVSTDNYDMGLDTQQSLFHLAFHGVSAISSDMFERFGQTYAPGETLFKEGEQGNQIFILLKGSVEVIKQERVLAQLLEGEIFGEMAILEEKPRSATIRAIDQVDVLALNKEQFQMVFQLHPTWTLQLIRGFALRIANCYRLLSH